MGRYSMEIAETTRITIAEVQPSITVRYPEVRLDFPIGYRGIPELLCDTDTETINFGIKTGGEITR